MYKKGLVCFLVLNFILGPISKVVAQPQFKMIEHEEQLWTAYFNQTRFSNKWGLWFDAHLRSKEQFYKGLSQGLIRPAAMFFLTEDLKLLAGYVFVNHFPADNHREISQPEHRFWQQLQWQVKYPKFRLAQWLRLEERYRRKIENDRELGDGYIFNYRVRYNFLAQFALGNHAFKKGSFSIAAGNELFLNFGRQIVYNTFDQNRFFAGIQYHVNRHDQLQIGYMNMFQQLAGGAQYRMNHIVRVFYFQALDLRKN